MLRLRNELPFEIDERDGQFDDVATDERRARREALARLVVVATAIHLSPVDRRTHVAAVVRLLDEAFADYEDTELKDAVVEAVTDGSISTDRLDRLVPPAAGQTSRQTAQAFLRAREASQVVASYDPPRSADVLWEGQKALRHELLTPQA